MFDIKITLFTYIIIYGHNNLNRVKTISINTSSCNKLISNEALNSEVIESLRLKLYGPHRNNKTIYYIKVDCRYIDKYIFLIEITIFCFCRLFV